MIFFLNQALLLTALISFWGALIYRFYALNNLGAIISLIIAGLNYWVFFLIFKKPKNLQIKSLDSKIDNINYFFEAKVYYLSIIYFLSLASCFFILIKNATSKSIISPWEAVPGYFFIFFALAISCLLFLINQKIFLGRAKISLKGFLSLKESNNYSLFFIFFFPLYFLSFSVAVIIYKIGYGFDPFIHEATINLINQKGLVEPKPFYYLGQYSLEIIFHKLSGISLIWIDKLLVPFLSALFLPLFLLKFITKKIYNPILAQKTVLFCLILPFNFFILTTPQNLAYLFFLLIILLGENIKEKNLSRLILVYSLALAALAIQPIAGIPAFSLALGIHLSMLKSPDFNQTALAHFFSLQKGFKYKLKNLKIKIIKAKLLIYFLLAAASALALPLAFYFFNKNIGSIPANFEAPLPTKSSTAFFQIYLPQTENAILNFIYFYGFNLKFFLALLALTGLIILFKKKNKKSALYFSGFLTFFSAYLITKNLNFNFLINYERENYSERILIIAILFLAPFIILALGKIIEKIQKENLFFKSALSLFGILIIAASLYLNYPRYDRYFNSRGYSTGEEDLKAVHWIEQDAKKSKYIVLANQQVSAAALREFGFKIYYKNTSGEEIFYYPIPTGGSLYQSYLKMVYDIPSRENALEAMNLAGVDAAYLVLNKYWWAFPKIRDEAKLSANYWSQLGDGKIYIFKYIK